LFSLLVSLSIILLLSPYCQGENQQSTVFEEKGTHICRIILKIHLALFASFPGSAFQQFYPFAQLSPA